MSPLPIAFPASIAGVVEVMMGITHARRSGSMVFSLVTRKLLARPRPYELHTSPTFNAGCMLSATGVEKCASCPHLMWAAHDGRGL